MDFDRLSQSGVRLFERPGSDIRITGYLKKLKTMKKKFFVLRSTSSSGPARLEYYDSEKKFNAGQLPKRSIHLHTCFNINRKSDGRHKYAIALYTKEECFSIVCEDEKEQENWLSGMLEYQNEYIRDDEKCREHYEHVWQVTVQPKGLGHTKNIRGSYRLCMTRHNICLVKLNSEKPQYIFQLETVRSLAHSENLFRLEVGKIAPTGEGELWMQADDSVTAQNLHETILSYMKDMERRGIESLRSSSTLPRSEFRNRTSSESHTSGRTRIKGEQRPVSVYTPAARPTSHLLSAISPGTSPHAHSLGDHPIMGHRLRSDSCESKASRSSIQAIPDDIMFGEMHGLTLAAPVLDITPLEEENDFHDFDQRSLPSSQGSHLDEYDGQSGAYMDMHPGSATPPSSNNSGYIPMAPGSQRDQAHFGSEGPSTYMPMNPSWQTSSAPIPIHCPEPSQGYMDMSHTPLPPVKEGGSNEGYLPMSPSYSASPSGSSSGHLRPDPVVCQLRDDVTDFAQPPLRTYSLGSRPVKPAPKHAGYVDMTVRKGVSDNGRSCSAPHLIANHPHHGRSGGGLASSTVDSPTPSASPLSVSLRSDDSDSFMELDFYRPRTASDSYSYRPRASSFGVQQKAAVQGHRPRSSSHGQGTRPVRRHKLIGVDAGRLSHDMLHRTSLNSSSHGSFDSLRVSSSESLRKLSLEVRAKTSQLNNTDYIDMSFEKRQTPSPQPGSLASTRPGQNGYVDMTLGARKSSPAHTKNLSRSSSKTNSMERLQDAEYTNMTLGAGDMHHSHHQDTSGRDSAYMNMEAHETGHGPRKHESPSRLSPAENADSYMPYEPAGAAGSSSGGGTTKVESVSPDPRNRSGSGGKEHKKWSFFSRRHGHDDSSKEASRKPDPQSQNRNAGGSSEKIVNLGHDIRRKSKDSSAKGGRQKSASFSRLLESRQASNAKQNKSMRKVPTPPRGSQEAMDEYIEFSPMAMKSDSDSSQSSGSTRASRRREEVVAAKTEPEYVGFEPGNIVSSKGSGNQTGSYVSMGSSTRIGGQASVFKPVLPSTKSSDARKSKGKKDGALPAPAAAAAARETTFQPVCKVSSDKTTVTCVADTVLCESSTSRACSSATSPTSASGNVASGSASFEERCQVETLPSTQHSPSSSCGTITTSSSLQSPVVCSSLKAGLQQKDSGYLDFDPGKPLSDAAHTSVELSDSPAAGESSAGKDKLTGFSAAPVSLPVVMEVPHSDSDVPPSPSKVSPSNNSPPASTKDRQETNVCVTPKARDVLAAVPSPGPSPDTRTRKISGGKLITRPTKGGNVGDQSPAEPSLAEFEGALVKAGDGKQQSLGGRDDGQDGGKVKESKAASSPRTAQSPPSPSSVAPSLVRPESTPCMLSMAKPGVGRGRHSSTSSKGSGGSSGGDGGGNGNGKTTSGMLHINTGSDSRHSITDLSGYEQMFFPSNALSRQQPAHSRQPQSQPSPAQVSSGSGSITGSQGVLNYATLDLGSADSLGESGDSNRSPRNKSRHPSSADEKGETLSYATIDYEKTESLRNSGNKDVKFTL